MKLRVGPRRDAPDYAATMTDISFLLIIFLVLCATFAAGLGLRLRLPDKDQPPQVLRADEVVAIVLAADGSCMVEGFLASDRAAAIAAAVSAKPGAVAVVEVAGEIAYRQVLDVLAEARDAGAERFSLKTAPRAPVPVKVGKPDAD